MTYEEFTALAKREISTTEYHEVVEPVYTYHPAIPNKETAAKLYDLCGLQVFRDMKPTAKRMEQLEDEERKINCAINEMRSRLDEIGDEVRKTTTATPIATESKKGLNKAAERSFEMRKYICITYHMAKLDGETAETCIDLPMDEKIADDILRAQRDSRYVKDAAWPIASILQNLAKLQGYDSSAFCMAKATFGKGSVER